MNDLIRIAHVCATDALASLEVIVLSLAVTLILAFLTDGVKPHIRTTTSAFNSTISCSLGASKAIAGALLTCQIYIIKPLS